MPTDYTIFEYCYRDASNYRAHERLLLSGAMRPGLEAEFRATMESGEYFVAEAVGLGPLQPRLYELSGGHATDDDHGWHEFVEIAEPSPDELTALSPAGSVDELLTRFQQMAGKWQV